MPPPPAAQQAYAAPAPQPAQQGLPVARPLLPTAQAIAPYLERIDAARWYSNFGPLLTEFEGRLADRFTSGTQVTTVANGTLALALTLAALELRPGLVAIPAWTFVATAHAVLQAGFTPWMIDVDPDSWMMNPADLIESLQSAPGPVRAVIPVAPHGQMPNLAAWQIFREETGLPVIIDAAAGFDAAVDADLPIMVSLHATKALGVGEGGFIATRDHHLARRLRQLTTYGFQDSRASQMPATNAKLSEYAAAVGLAALDGWPATRMRLGLAAQRLRLALANTPQVVFQPGWGSRWVSSVCVVSLPQGRAAEAEAALAAKGVDTRRWWGEGCHRSPAFAGLPHTAMTHTEQLAGATLGLPYSVDMTPEDCARIGAVLQRVLAG